MLGIIITGLPASGKTYYTDWLIKELYKKGPVYHIFGDALAHCSYNCQYTKHELNIKYDVMNYQIIQAKNNKYKYIVIDDLFKRNIDFFNITSLFDHLLIIKLVAPLPILIERNNKRPKYHRLSIKMMEQYAEKYYDIVKLDSFGIEIDVSNIKQNKVKKVIIDKIKEIETCVV